MRRSVRHNRAIEFDNGMRFSQCQVNVNVIQADIASYNAAGIAGARNGAPIIREKTRNYNNDSANHNNANNNNNSNNGQRKPYCHICKKKRSFDDSGGKQTVASVQANLTQ